MAQKDSVEEVTKLLEKWDQEFTTSADWSSYYSRLADPETTVSNIISLLQRMSEIVELEMELWYKKDPDPFDDRHPGRSDPNSALGNVLKAIYKNDEFIIVTVNNYMCGRGESESINLLHTITARLLLNIIPGLESTVVFLNNEALVRNLIDWSQTDNEPLASYAVGLLAAAMECQDIAATFKENNNILVPYMIKKLILLREKSDIERPFKDIGKDLRQLDQHHRNASAPLLNKRKYSQDEDSILTIVDGNCLPNSSIDTNIQTSKKQKLNDEMIHYEESAMDKQGVLNENLNQNITGNDNDPKFFISTPSTDNYLHNVDGDLFQVPNRDSTNFIIEERRRDSEENLLTRKQRDNKGCDVFKNINKECDVKNADCIKNYASERIADCSSDIVYKVLEEVDDAIDVVKSIMDASTTIDDDYKDEATIVENSINLLTDETMNSVINDEERIEEVFSNDEDDDADAEKLAMDLTTKDVCSNLIGRSIKASDSWMSPNRQITQVITNNEHSGSKWSEVEHLVIGTYQMWPLSIQMRQRFILIYLQQIGEYQELLSHVFEQPVMDLIFYYIDLKRNKDVRLAFEALRYLAALLCHKRFATEFITVGGVQKFLDIHRPSVAATGVSMCLYYLAYFEDAMERVCLLPSNVLKELVSYGLWLLECSHESGRVHATMFFGLSFSFRIIVELFDQQDGLRKLFNVMSTLQIFNIEDQSVELSEDELLMNKRSGRHVSVAIRRYLELHLGSKADHIRRSQVRQDGGTPTIEISPNKATKFSPEVIQSNIELLLEQLPARSNWKPVTDLIKLGAIQTLVQLLVTAQDWPNYAGKVETMKSALDIISICCVIPRAQLMLCHMVKVFNNNGYIPAISALLILCSFNVNLDVEVQKAALNVIINCVGGPISKVGGLASRSLTASAKRKSGLILADEQVVDMWQAVRTNNGIMALLNLLTIKYPVTEADGVRALACRALVGLSRCDTVKQIISKLPMFCNSQIQQLLWEPVLPDKRAEHARFCKYALQLIEQVSGKHPPASTDASLDRMRRADIVSQTPISFHKKELLQLMLEHLIKEGLTKTASTLASEADLSINLTQISSHLTAQPQSHTSQPLNQHNSLQINYGNSCQMTPSRLLNKSLIHQVGCSNNHINPNNSIQLGLNTFSPVKSAFMSKFITQSSQILENVNTKPPNNLTPPDIINENLDTIIPNSSEGTQISSPMVTEISNKVIVKIKKQPALSSFFNYFKLKQNEPNSDFTMQRRSLCYSGYTPNSSSINNKSPNGGPRDPLRLGTNIMPTAMNQQNVSLSDIVTSYLQHQHTNCRYPAVMATLR